VTQECCCVDVGENGEDVADGIRVAGMAETRVIGVEGASIEERLGRVGTVFFHVFITVVDCRKHYLSHFHMRVAAVRRCGRPGQSTKTRRTRKCSCAQAPKRGDVDIKPVDMRF
jgi:hypothetical protein